ncbi:hypothetical protein A2631_04945 [Candidatus Daviesbacteria bacterium RIFCSPHIGHO2_01_FULL_44_29]|uniref:Zinc finger DksA/TraR C4-type domain-containing protein n=1 Tax=Candidatus Daviesbacteria bacterium RIFCSPHIGHO2_02_FULL_43_12 TaxID=1797776 RepID=A0A1F5KGT7_9BACT|nr:MAG: hypothetical protein A2631_04945 [Candidatus Daviesbacteria bacterium RIFCSPHIGHO2_01_FULL_44_29]OGE40069.1 MAG: hypothetical protein A3D25_04675 [Candidatus Daviesbacteria bacterium RIFCSPHIGHO2_02_FULL_43_12]OGE41449.1 MAG: hypothetical protein A3E86_05135 [Candidatus Daviesbacteria bacterium RIFCSPHIGHO2_12_FULL_47_45]OGE70251.1 MAG: hypothetical protein A3B55_00895 [Candidatus Daviesbacteria bacterium RIFCSPLOWO2_01_FULL_43_15]
MSNLNQIKQSLEEQKKQLLQRLDSFATEDLFLRDSVSEVSSAEHQMWLTEVAPLRMEVKAHSGNLLKEIQHSLQRLEQGSYGRCEKCGQQIDAQRLRIIATAAKCQECSK